MVRFAIIGIVIAVAFTLYAVVDAAMTDAARARGVSKPVWIVLILVLPVLGGILWFTVGRGTEADAAAATQRRTAPDDDPRFSGAQMSDAELEEHMRELEDRLRELDDEVFPGEEEPRRDSDRDGESSAEEQKTDAADVKPEGDRKPDSDVDGDGSSPKRS